MKNIIMASTSTVHGSGYLEYLFEELEEFFFDMEDIVFIPYARPSGMSHEDYTAHAAKGFSKIKKQIRGLHEFDDPKKAVENAQAIFTGGGNTFLLVYQLYKNGLMEYIRKAVKNGCHYLGTSAGSNICGLTMNTTNDMPIVYPPSFKTLSFVPFNINPHYLDPIPDNKHMGETRETRINEFHNIHSQPVVGLREGSWLHIQNEDILLKGNLTARIFERDKKAYEVQPETNLKGLK